MNKKIVKMVIAVIVILVIGLGVIYLIDVNRMKNDMPVLFSTWGRKSEKNLAEPTKNMGLENVDVERQTKEKDLYFYGKVIESTRDTIIIEPNKDETIRKSADKIAIDLGKANDAIYKVGSNVKVTYNGYVMETYPAKIEAIDIELKSAQYFELKLLNFYDKMTCHVGESKINKIVDKTKNKKYSYNIYTYKASVNIIIDGKKQDLKDALQNGKITMEEIIEKANKDLEDKKINGDMYRDGGSMIYQYKTYTIIKCHTLDGNRDVYIGTPDMTINDVL